MSDILMYEVKRYPRGYAVLYGPDPEGFFHRVAARIADYGAGRLPPYDMQTLLFNVECVCKDIRAGRIAEPPDDVNAWVDAVVAEFTSNDGAARP